MKYTFVFILIFPLWLIAQPGGSEEIKRWQKQAAQVTIIRDNWGIPHVYGKTDADAVFGLLFAQCEDDFKRVEMNYIEKLGRLAEVKGESELYNDLLIRMLIDSTEAINDYNKAETWLKDLLNAYADGINYFLYKNPEVRPSLLYRFKPWYPLLWTDGSIGAINTADITTTELKNFYSGDDASVLRMQKDADNQTGSNGFAIGPSKTSSGNAILYINPHVTFYFRPEVQVVSEEGLNVYGAVTWGQFFVYQGFNEHCGWMHTSSDVDVADLYEEKIVKRNGSFFYEYNKSLRPVKQKKITINYKEGNRILAKSVTAYYTHHGPVMARRAGKWISLRSYNRSAVSLKQSWLRTKAKGLNDYKKVMEMKGNTSNNTVFADATGNIAYWHGNYIPKRDKQKRWWVPVDGTTTATEWKGLHNVDETVHLYNPPNGWIQNCNSTPFTSAGNNSPKRSDYPGYMAPDGENFRGINAVRVLSSDSNFTIDKVIAAGYNTYLPAFAILIPALTRAFDKIVQSGDTLYSSLKGPVDVLRGWNYHSGEASVATTLAVEWAQKVSAEVQRVYINEGEIDQVQKTLQFANTATPELLLPPLLDVIRELEHKFGKWQMSWGDLNRYQRRTGSLQETYDDSQPSLPVGFASAVWGMLPSYNSRYFPGTDKRYGVSGNSFVCAVEFGKRIQAKSLLAGGESGNVSSRHFSDQAHMYTKGQFKDVLFYKEDIVKAAQKTYHPGE